jgi:hypothetical protein
MTCKRAKNLRHKSCSSFTSLMGKCVPLFCRGLATLSRRVMSAETCRFRWAVCAASLAGCLFLAIQVNAQSSPAALPDLRLSRAGTINALVALDDGHIIIGGSFTSVNGFPVTNLARLNSSGALDAVWLPNPNGSVSALAASGTNLFVGGQFQQIGGQARSGLARLGASGRGEADPDWNPQPDTPVINALAVTGTNLFVGGAFHSIGGQNRTNISKLDAAGTGGADPLWHPKPDDAVDAVVASGTNVYLGGHFIQIGATSRLRLARLSTEGSGALDLSWNPAVDFAVSNTSSGSYVSVLLLNGTNLYVSGVFTNVGGLARAGLSKLDANGVGTTDPNWDPHPEGSAGPFHLAASGTNLFVGGGFTTINNFNIRYLAKVGMFGSGPADSSWTPAVNSPRINALLAYSSWLFVSGGFSLAEDQVSLGIAKFDQATGVGDEGFYAQVATPGIVRALARQNDGKVIFGGDFWLAGFEELRNLGRINPDGSRDGTWGIGTDAEVNALALNGSSLFVGGSFRTIGAASRNGMAKMDTGGLTQVDSSWNPGPGSLAVVNALAVDSSKLYVGGDNLGFGGQSALSFGRVGVAGAGLVESNWNAVADGPVLAMVVSQTNVFVGGSFTSIRTNSLKALAKFSTTGSGAVDPIWNADINAGGTATVKALAASGADLFLGGSFATVGNQGRAGLAKVSTLSTGAVDLVWNPAVLNVLGTVTARALTFSGTNVYVGGEFGSSPMNLARVSVATGSVDFAWHPNPRGGAVQALLTSGSDLYLGGSFQFVGGSDLSGIDAAPRNGFAFLPVADAPVFIMPSPPNFTLARNPADGPEVTHFRIIGITGGTLTLTGGVTQVSTGAFITVEQGSAGLVFFGTNGTVTAVSALENTTNGAGTASSTLNIGGPAPGPVFSFASAAYSVVENGGSVVLSVRKHGAGAASVSYATASGSASADVDYTNAVGMLSFLASDTNKTITVGIFNDSFFEGDETFTVTLSNPTNGAVIAYPGTATVTILENDPIISGGSNLTNQAPAAPPPAAGVLSVFLQPPAASGQWCLAGERNWHASGSTVSNLITGNYRIEFQPVNGYRSPDAMIAPVTSGQTLALTNFYVASSNSGVGFLTVALAPESVATNASLAARGQWRLNGTTNWLNSGDSLTNLNAGVYLVEFKDVTNQVSPPSLTAFVFDNQGGQLTGTYLLASEPAGVFPSALSFESASTSPPYFYTGQIRTDKGFGSGAVVGDRVVLTAAHLLFDDVTLSYIGGVRWFFQRYAGRFEPPSQLPRATYIFSGYAAQRQADQSPGVATAQSQNLDMAALVFSESAGRGGFSGYLVSDSTNWLTSSRPKILVGYPMEVVPLADKGKPHASSPSNFVCLPAYSNVYATTNVRGSPGLSGAPLMVQADNGSYFPAGIYLGPDPVSARLRAIDPEMAAKMFELLNLNAAWVVSAGTIIINRGSSTANTLTVILGPQAAVDAGGGWRLGCESGSTFHTGPMSSAYIGPGSGCSASEILLYYKPLCGFGLPRPQSISLPSGGGATILHVDYLPRPAPPTLAIELFPSLVRLSIAGLQADYTYWLEYTDNTLAGATWTRLVRVESTTTIFVTTDPRLNDRIRFYRVALDGCPP